jgi:hypothetical protein
MADLPGKGRLKDKVAIVAGSTLVVDGGITLGIG